MFFGTRMRVPTRFARLRLGLAVTAVAIGLFHQLGCGGAGPTGQTAPPKMSGSELRGDISPENLNIVLVTIDTLRTDRISSYGSESVDTPNIDSFAEEGVRFSNAASTVPFTLPAHSSILTGLYPPGHGVRENVGYVLDESIPTLAEVLSSEGWSTAGFVSSFVLDRRWGIGRGFDHYFDDFDLSEFEDTPNLSSVQRSGDVTIAEAVRWLDDRPKDSPFFLWLHLYDPHDPYTPPEPWKSMYPDRPYEGEVAYTDSLIGDFRQALSERGLLSNSLVILTADHGEGLGNHGEASHGFFLYETTIHVALIVRPPDGRLAGRVVDSAVSHVDLFPTILDAVGVSAPKRVHGESLLPLISGDGDSERSVYSESLYPLLHYGWAPLRAIRTGRHKLINAPRAEVFNVVTDPREAHDLSAEQPAVVEDLEVRLTELRAKIESETPAVGSAPDIDPQTLAQLQALGYAAGQGGVSVEQEGDRPRADPKDKIGLHRATMRAQSKMTTDPEAAEQALVEILGEDPEILDAHQMLAQLAVTQDRFKDALGHFSRVLELEPEHETSLMGMAAAYRALGQREEALVGFRRVIEVSGPDTRATLAIADIEFERGNFDLAASALEEAVETTEMPALIHNKLGEVRVEQGRAGEAMTLFALAVEEKDDFALPYFNIAVLYEERGEAQQAVANYEKAIELESNYHQAQFNLGRLVGRMGQLDRQQELWEASIESNPNFVQGYYSLSKLVMDRGGDLGRAEGLVRLGIDNDPDHKEGPFGYYILADILNRTGRASEAREAVATGQRIQSEMK